MIRRLALDGWVARLVLLGLLPMGAGAARADVVIGVAVPRSGAYVAVGEQVLRGVRAAARDANAKGGLDGQPIVLMADRQTAGGYPKIASVASVDLGVLAQMAAPEAVRFELVTLVDAQRLYLAREREYSRLRQVLEGGT